MIAVGNMQIAVNLTPSFIGLLNMKVKYLIYNPFLLKLRVFIHKYLIDVIKFTLF